MYNTVRHQRQQKICKKVFRVYKHCVPGVRKKGQTVDAFSLPASLLSAARLKAVSMGFTRSGYYRYALAKELGYGEEQARQLADNQATQNSIARAQSYPPHEHSRLELNEASSARPKPKTVEEALALTEERERARDQSPEVPVTTGRSGGPSRRKQRPGAT